MVPDTSPAQLSAAGRRPMAVAAWACAIAAPFLLGVGIALAVLGMVLGSGAHLKADRWGMPAAVVSGVACLVAMALVFFLQHTG